MLHKTKHGAYFNLVGRPKSWWKPSVASVQLSTAKLCEWKVKRSLSRAALPPHQGWKLHWVSFLRQFSEAGLGSDPSSGWAYRRWVRSLLNITQNQEERAGRVCTGLFPSGVCPVLLAGSKRCAAEVVERVSPVECGIATEGISCCCRPQEPFWNVIWVIWPKFKCRWELSLLLTPTKCWGCTNSSCISKQGGSIGYVAL